MRLREGGETNTFVHFMTWDGKDIHAKVFITPFLCPSLTGSVSRELAIGEPQCPHFDHWLLIGFHQHGGTHNWRKKDGERKERNQVIYSTRFHHLDHLKLVPNHIKSHSSYGVALSYSYFLWFLLIASISISFRDSGYH